MLKKHEQKSTAFGYEIMEPCTEDKEVNFLVAFLKFLCLLTATTFLVMVLFEWFSRINNI